MKKYLTLIIVFVILSCSNESSSDSPENQNISGTLNIPEVFRGEFEGVQTHHWAKIYENYLQVETDSGIKTITQGTDEYFNGNNHYEVDLPNNEKLVLLFGNNYVGITVFDSEGEWIISDYFD